MRPYYIFTSVFNVDVILQMKWLEVVQDCSQAVEFNPRYVKALFRRAKALERLDNKKECLEGLFEQMNKTFYSHEDQSSHLYLSRKD